MMDDTKFDDLIAHAARQLDPPADPPRDAMWAAIQEARAEARAEDVVPITSAASTSVKARYAPAPWLRYGAALAAMLVIGVGIGRITSGMRSGTTNPQATADARPADPGTRTTDAGPAGTATGTDTAVSGSADAVAGAADVPDAADAPGAAGAAGAGRDALAADPRLAAIDRPPVTRVTPVDGGPALARSTRPAASPGAITRGGAGSRTYDTMLPYRIVARRHLERVQTLLVSLPEDVRAGRINEVAVRAADLLVSTRLLLDTPAAEDARMRTLLDDLELILAQAATISPTRSTDDVEIIQNAINQRDVLLRLHAATAGSRLSGT